MLRACIFAITLCLSCPAYTANHNLAFHWQDTFSAAEQQRLRDWIAATDRALTRTVGPLPFTRHIYFHRLANASEPVPWAHTQRGPEQGVHFYVDPSFSQQAFLADWTAPHELSHLIMPYLGESNSWFAEGFASYMQYQVMHTMGVLAADEMQARYASRIQRAASRYPFHTLPFAQAAPKLRAQRQYPTMYWGGAVFFLQADEQLKTQGSSLLETLGKFTTCCRTKTSGIKALLAQLDRISDAQIFTTQWHKFSSEPGFPTL